MSISKSTILASTFETLYSSISTITDPSSKSMTWTGAFPDTDTLSKTDYPIGVIDTPKIDIMEDLNINYSTANTGLMVTITAFTTQSEWAARISDKVIDKIDTIKATLEGKGLFFKSPLISMTDSGHFTRSGFKVHFYTVQFGFSYTYDRS